MRERRQEVKDVNIYVHTQYKGPIAAGNGAWHVILECMVKTAKGMEPATVKEFGFEENITRNRLELLAVTKGLEHINAECNITIHTDSEYVENVVKNGWIDKWLINNFKLKNKPIKHADLWKIFEGYTENITIFRENKTAYTRVQKLELEKTGEIKK